MGVFRFAAILVVVALFRDPLLIHSSEAQGRVEHQTTACKSDGQGNYYVALGRYVLAMPYSKHGAYMIDPLRRGDIGFAPPDPTEREGCSGNPLQSRSYEILHAPYDFGPIAGSDAGSETPQAETLTFYRTLRGSPSPHAGDPEWAGADLRMLIWDKTCKVAAVREELPNGLTVCRIKLHWPSDPVAEARQENWGASYRARPDVYAAPLGKPFVFDCGPLLLENTISDCNVAYAMARGLGVGYRFQPYLGKHHIPIDRVIEYDRGLRAAIESTIVKDYSWKEERAIDATTK